MALNTNVRERAGTGGLLPAPSHRISGLVPVLSAGVAIGVLEVVVATSFAALVFSGGLSRFVPAGIGLALVGAVVSMLIVALFTSVPGSVSSVQDSTAAILALVAIGVAERVPPGSERALPTLAVTIGLAAVLTGAFFLALGSLRLGNLVRFVPYPVIGGFLAGTGWLLAKGALGVLADAPVSLAGMTQLVSPETASRWAPGVGFAVALLLLSRRYHHFLTIPSALLAGALLFFGALFASGGTLREAQAGGWLIGPLPERSLWRPWALTGLAGADWSAIISQAGNLVTLAVIAVLALLLNASAIEVSLDRDADINRELRAAGMANAVAGLGGGMVGFHALSLTVLADRMGAATRLVGVVSASVCGLALLLGASLLSLFPRPLLGGLLLFLGLGFLTEWLYDARFRLRGVEYGVVVLILLAVATVGFLPGVAVGVGVAVALFVVDYSRTDLVKHTLSGTTFRSKLDRPARARDRLREEGEQIHILELQGFVFFGTANGLLDRIRERLGDVSRPPLRFLVLDFRRVTGIDSSAVLSFAKAQKLAESAGFHLVLTGITPSVRRPLERAGFAGEDDRIRIVRDLDRGVEWCEERLLQEVGSGGLEHEPLWTQLRDRLPEADPARLVPYLDRMEVPGGHQIIRQGDPSRDIYFLESGRLTAFVEREERDPVRLRTMGPGTVVGEVAMYLRAPRAATVVSEERSTLYRLSGASLRRMEERDPQLAAAVHRMLAGLLAERLADTLETVKALSD